MTNRIPLLIDTDPGVDDALALLMAFNDPRHEVVGLTIAAGNVGLEHTLRNALKLRAIAGVDDPREKLRRLIDNHLRFFVENMAEMKVLSHEAQSLTGEFRTNLNGRKHRITQLATETLREIHPQTPLDDRVSAFALFGMMNWLYAWYRPDRDVDVDRLVSDMTRIFMQGYLGCGDEARSDPPGPRIA